MRFLTNTHDPKEKKARERVSRLYLQTEYEAWLTHVEWLEGKIIGDPQESETYTVAQLKEMGLVGVYMPEDNDVLKNKEYVYRHYCGLDTPGDAC